MAGPKKKAVNSNSALGGERGQTRLSWNQSEILQGFGRRDQLSVIELQVTEIDDFVA